ncbi:hypothetical protein [Bacillus sp. AFS017336]|uniref:hypothetical protein n=1 Tax=Bacillus sp. AFS017336 TaxID=2033489 RepID=UPI000BF1EFCD|nr:hypothetical protein [Bacillus sp. AFS017336]PEL13776.1 hypothetical protein CN601_03425 [Bacillus sp. AFS017336]
MTNLNNNQSKVESYINYGEKSVRDQRNSRTFTNNQVVSEINSLKGKVKNGLISMEQLNDELDGNDAIWDMINSEEYAKTHNHKKKNCKRAEEDWFCTTLESLADEILMVDKMNKEAEVRDEMLNDAESDLTFTQRMSKKYDDKTILSKNAQSNNSIREVYIHEEKYNVTGSIHLNQLENEVANNNPKVTKVLKREVSEEDFKKFDKYSDLSKYQDAINKLKERLKELSAAPTVNNSTDDNTNVNINFTDIPNVSQEYLGYINSTGYLRKWINELTYEMFQVKEAIRKPIRSNNTKSDVDIFDEAFADFEFSNVEDVNKLFKMKNGSSVFAELKEMIKSGSYTHIILSGFEELLGQVNLTKSEREIVDLVLGRKVFSKAELDEIYPCVKDMTVIKNVIVDYIFMKHSLTVRQLESLFKKISTKLVHTYLNGIDKLHLAYKTCNTCGEDKLLNERNFPVDKMKNDGYKDQCKSCKSEVDRKRYINKKIG